MLSILAAALALVSADPTTNFAQQSKVETSDPIVATCTIKSPTNNLMQVPCAVVALRDDTVTGVGFATEGGNILFVGVLVDEGLQVGAIMVGDTPYEAQGACVATEGKVTCVAAPVGGTATLAVQAVY